MHCKRTWLAIVAIVAGVLISSSCATTSAPSTTSETSTSGKPYGSLRVAGSSVGSASLDPQQGAGVAAHHGANAAIYDSLVELTPDAKARPGIAERWEIAPDGLTHTFYIRKGVKFHNGDDLTGEDVKFSLERIIAPDSTSGFASMWRGAIAKVDLKDPFTVVLSLKSPRFELLEALGDMGGAAAIVPKKYIEEKGVEYFRKNPVGSGPWKVLSYIPGDRLELEAVESHWRQVPQFKNITHLIVPNEASKVAMLKTGELDLAEVSADSAPGLKSAGLRLYVHDGGGRAIAYLFWDLDQPDKYPLGDLRVRRALSLGIDRKEMADKLYGGYAEPMFLEGAARTAFFFDANVMKPDPYDPEGAKKLLAEAGYSNGFDMKIWDRTDADWNTFNVALGGYWRKIGIKAEIIRIDYASKLGAMLRAVPKPLEVQNSVFGVAGGGGGNLQFERMAARYHSKLSSFKNTRNPKLDELIDKVPATLDPIEKKRLATEAVLMARNEYGIIAFLHVNSLVALGPKIGEFKPVQQVSYYVLAYDTITRAK